jgi:hypothetical protein
MGLAWQSKVEEWAFVLAPEDLPDGKAGGESNASGVARGAPFRRCTCQHRPGTLSPRCVADCPRTPHPPGRRVHPSQMKRAHNC